MEASATPVAAMIGDVVGSRTASDRAGLHTRLSATIEQVNDEFSPVRALRVTVGDEYQGVFPSVGQALAAALILRIRLADLSDGAIDVRHGVGWGLTAVLDDAGPGVEDGPAWWAARDAVSAVEASESVAASRHRRTAYRLAPDTPGPQESAVNAALVLCDEMTSQLSPRSMSVLHGLLEAQAQKDIADRLDISASAVSQRVRTDGLAAIVAAATLMGEIR